MIYEIKSTANSCIALCSSTNAVTFSIARVDPLPLQLEAVYDYFLRLPRIRFLLADDPRAGKRSWQVCS
jgi:hypothetical protein